MIKIDLKSPFIDPKWYRSVYGREFIINNVDAHTLTIEGQALSHPFPKGTDVRVLVKNSFYAETVAEYKKRKDDQAKTVEQERLEDIVRRNELRDKALRINSSIKLPVLWAAARKDNLSGLSPNSWGDGSKKNTVYHILLLGDIKAKRLRKSKGDYLCSSRPGMGGKNWSWSNETPITHLDGDGNEYRPAPTCKDLFTPV